ncbi:hypothetical protein OAD66_00210 [Bacteroidia bacterium]|nr:hypothetical protein [Bacteroidia bacterium]
MQGFIFLRALYHFKDEVEWDYGEKPPSVLSYTIDDDSCHNTYG